MNWYIWWLLFWYVFWYLLVCIDMVCITACIDVCYFCMTWCVACIGMYCMHRYLFGMVCIKFWFSTLVLSYFLPQETILASMACTATHIGVYWIRHVVLTCIQKQSWIHDDLNLEAYHHKYSSCGMHWVCIVVCIGYVLTFIGIYENLFAGSLVDEGW